MQIRLIEDHHLQVGPVTVALAHQRLLSLLCRLASPYARHDGAEHSGEKRASTPAHRH